MTPANDNQDAGSTATLTGSDDDLFSNLRSTQPSRITLDVTDPQTWDDVGNARRLIEQYGAELRYVTGWGRWMVWDDARWVMDETGRVTRMAIDTLDGMFGYLKEIPDSTQREGLFKFVNNSRREPRIRAMVNLAASMPGIAVRPNELDADLMVLNTLSGTIDLRSGELKPHDPSDLITKLAPVSYDEDVAAPNWDAFLARVLPDADVRAYVQRVIGYSLTGLTTERAMFILYGDGANGKSKFLEAIDALLGDYAVRTRPETLLTKRSSGITNDIARLDGPRFVSASETEDGKRLAEALIKEMTGDEKITARRLYQDYFSFKPQFKLFVATNHKPEIRGSDAAIWDRIHLIPFTVRIPEAQRDPNLGDKLKAELPGILVWALAGLREWQRQGLNPPEAVKAATAEYRDEMDVLGAYLAERTLPDASYKVPAKALHGDFKRWAEEAGEYALKQRKFYERLREHSVRLDESGHVLYAHGLKLRAPTFGQAAA